MLKNVQRSTFNAQRSISFGRGRPRSRTWLSAKHALHGLVVVCLLFAASCRTPAPEVGRYQWCVVTGDEYDRDKFHVVDTVTGEVAVWNGSSWSPSYKAPLSTPDWDLIRAKREKEIKQKAEREKQAKEAREKRDALIKSYAQMPLEKLVPWAKTISVVIHDIPKSSGLLRRRSSFFPCRTLESLKREGGLCSDECRQPYKATDEGLVVWFHGEVDGGLLDFGLSHTPIPDVSRVFAAPATIIDDVKAEIKRQEAMQKKESRAENH